MSIDTAACELTEATKRVEEQTEELNKIKFACNGCSNTHTRVRVCVWFRLLHSQAVNRWCEGASCVDRIGEWTHTHTHTHTRMACSSVCVCVGRCVEHRFVRGIAEGHAPIDADTRAG